MTKRKNVVYADGIRTTFNNIQKKEAGCIDNIILEKMRQYNIPATGCYSNVASEIKEAVDRKSVD